MSLASPTCNDDDDDDATRLPTPGITSDDKGQALAHKQQAVCK
jgi:hypothetical protein